MTDLLRTLCLSTVALAGCASGPPAVSARPPAPSRAPRSLPSRTERITRAWPRWTPSSALTAARERCSSARAARLDPPRDAPNALDASASSEAYAYVAETFIFNYPLGPISTGVGFRGEAHRQWRSLYEARALLPRSNAGQPLCVEPQFVAQPADGQTGCETIAMLTDALRDRPLRQCHDGATDATVVVRAMVTPDGWLIPIEASARSEHAAIAQCAGRALAAFIDAPHREEAGAETVLALHWSRARCLR